MAAAKRGRRKRRTKAVLLHEAEMRRIDERIAVACYYGSRAGAGELEDWLTAVESSGSL